MYILSICNAYTKHMHTLYTNDLVNLINALVSRKHMQGICNFSVIEFIYLFNALNFKRKLFVYALHMHKAQRGHKLSVVRKVVTPLNFVTPPSFSVTPPSCKPGEAVR
jgi:hypothetical protein